jgi:hypothetical protein
MSIVEDKYIKLLEDINFLLELCRVLLRRIKTYNPNKEIPVSIEELKRLRSIEQIYKEGVRIQNRYNDKRG